MQHTELLDSRKKVEKIDAQILSLLKKRFVLTEKIQSIKHILGLPIWQKAREKALLNKYTAAALKKGLPPSLVKNLCRLLFSYGKKTGIIKRF